MRKHFRILAVILGFQLLASLPLATESGMVERKDSDCRLSRRKKGRGHMAPRLLLAALLLFCPCALLAQTARQGTEILPEGEFRSPMILETALTVADPATWNDKPVQLMESLRSYSCEGVSIANIVMRATQKDDGFLRVALQSYLVNRPGHDKYVTLTFEVLVEGKPVGKPVKVVDLDVEEKKSAVANAVMVLHRDSLPKAPLPKLRITVAVRDN